MSENEKSKHVVVMHDGALDEILGGAIILRGVLDCLSLEHLRVAEYQRENLPFTRMSDKAAALSVGAVPDIDLGMRGGNFDEKPTGTFKLYDPIYLIDGMQRRTWALECLKRGTNPHLGAIVHFNTTEESEAERFRVLNSTRTKVNNNIILRNQAKYSIAITTFLELCLDNKFALFNRVCWAQTMNREQLISAVTLLRVIGRLHANIASGMMNGLRQLVLAMDRWATTNQHALKMNTYTFFELIERCWGLRLVNRKISSPQVSFAFLQALAKLLAEHGELWKNSMLIIPDKFANKLKGFPITDPQIRALCMGGGTAGAIVYELLAKCVKGQKVTGRSSWSVTPPPTLIQKPLHDAT